MNITQNQMLFKYDLNDFQKKDTSLAKYNCYLPSHQIKKNKREYLIIRIKRKS